jgi:hypothetical protein
LVAALTAATSASEATAAAAVISNYLGIRNSEDVKYKLEWDARQRFMGSIDLNLRGRKLRAAGAPLALVNALKAHAGSLETCLATCYALHNVFALPPGAPKDAENSKPNARIDYHRLSEDAKDTKKKRKTSSFDPELSMSRQDMNEMKPHISDVFNAGAPALLRSIMLAHENQECRAIAKIVLHQAGLQRILSNADDAAVLVAAMSEFDDDDGVVALSCGLLATYTATVTINASHGNASRTTTSGKGFLESTPTSSAHAVVESVTPQDSVDARDSLIPDALSVLCRVIESATVRIGDRYIRSSRNPQTVTAAVSVVCNLARGLSERDNARRDACVNAHVPALLLQILRAYSSGQPAADSTQAPVTETDRAAVLREAWTTLNLLVYSHADACVAPDVVALSLAALAEFSDNAIILRRAMFFLFCVLSCRESAHSTALNVSAAMEEQIPRDAHKLIFKTISAHADDAEVFTDAMRVITRLARSDDAARRAAATHRTPLPWRVGMPAVFKESNSNSSMQGCPGMALHYNTDSVRILRTAHVPSLNVESTANPDPRARPLLTAIWPDSQDSRKILYDFEIHLPLGSPECTWTAPVLRLSSASPLCGAREALARQPRRRAPLDESRYRGAR